MVAGISTLFETRRVSEAKALWLLEDRAFVDTLLDVVVDGEVGGDIYWRLVGLLRQGYSKHHVLACVATEFQDNFFPARMPGIRRRLKRYRWVSLPVAGPLLRRIFDLPSEDLSARRLRAIENHLYLLAHLVLDSYGEQMLPAAPWGGVHRQTLLQDLLVVEAGMTPEIRDVYRALMAAAARFPLSVARS